MTKNSYGQQGPLPALSHDAEETGDVRKMRFTQVVVLIAVGASVPFTIELAVRIFGLSPRPW
jgi:hypothetical protein